MSLDGEAAQALIPEQLLPSHAPAALTVASAVADRILDRVFDEELERWGRMDSHFREPLLALRRFVDSGGKRLRPSFCYWAAVGSGVDPENPLLARAMAGLEFLHTFALVHDDVMDNSATRRGEPSLHQRYRMDHVREGLRGSPEHYGNAMAILAGDLAFALADRMFQPLGFRPRQVFSELKVEVNLGQYLDIAGGVMRESSLERSERTAIYKSAKYTVERPMHIGSALSGGSDRALALISKFAVPLGLAFQLKDDILGAFGDAAVTRKPVGDDLREGKPTLLVALARRELSPEERSVFDEHFGQAGLDTDGIGILQRLIAGSGAVGRLEDRIDGLLQEAVDVLDRLPFTREARIALAELTAFVVDREA